MVELSFMASASFSPAVFHQEPPPPQQLGLCRPAPKEFQSLLPRNIAQQEILRSGSLQLKSSELEDSWQSKGLLSEGYFSAKPVPAVNKSVLIDVEDSCPDSVLFSFGIVEQCTRHERILQFLMSGSNISEGGGLNISLLSDLMGLHTLSVDMQHQPSVHDDFCLYEVGNDVMQPSLIYSPSELHSPKRVLNFIGDLSHSSVITAHSDGRVLFMGSEAETKDILSIVSEYYLSKNTTGSNKHQMVVPYFRRHGTGARAGAKSSLKFQTETVTPLKSPEKMKLKPQPKKQQNRKAGRERNLYRNNYSHACESFLSMILDKDKGRDAILSLKKSGPALPHLLAQFSACVAGTGLAVLFSVILKINSGRGGPFCITKLLNTGFGFGLFWLSWAVNALRGDIVCITKNSSKPKWKEDEMVSKVNRSVNEILIRAATLMAVAILRFS